MAKRATTPTTIADANRVVRMVRQGKAVPMAHLRAALLLQDDAKKTMAANIRIEKRANQILSDFIDRTSR